MPQQFVNNFSYPLRFGINAAAVALDLGSEAATRLADASADNFYLLTLVEGDQIEIVKCTGVAAGVLTIARAQEGTSAQVFTTAAAAQARITAGTLAGLQGGGGGGGLVLYHDPVIHTASFTIDPANGPVQHVRYTDSYPPIVVTVANPAADAWLRLFLYNDSGSGYNGIKFDLAPGPAYPSVRTAPTNNQFDQYAPHYVNNLLLIDGFYDATEHLWLVGFVQN